MPFIPATQTATVPNAGTTSPAVDMSGLLTCGVFFPAVMTGTAISFTASPTSGGTFGPVKDSTGATVSVTFVASAFVALDPAVFAGVQFIKVVSNASEGAARDVVIVGRQ